MRTPALGVYTAMTGMGGGVGVVAGGLLTTYASWRWVLFVNMPLGLALALGARYVLPESQRYPRRWDLPGAATGTAGFALLIYGLTRGATGPDGISHWADTATIATLAGAAVALTAFVLAEARSKQPRRVPAHAGVRRHRRADLRAAHHGPGGGDLRRALRDRLQHVQRRPAGRRRRRPGRHRQRGLDHRQQPRQGTRPPTVAR
jgi:hypothetical protein